MSVPAFTTQGGDAAAMKGGDCFGVGHSALAWAFLPPGSVVRQSGARHHGSTRRRRGRRQAEGRSFMILLDPEQPDRMSDPADQSVRRHRIQPGIRPETPDPDSLPPSNARRPSPQNRETHERPRAAHGVRSRTVAPEFQPGETSCVNPGESPENPARKPTLRMPFPLEGRVSDPRG